MVMEAQAEGPHAQHWPAVPADPEARLAAFQREVGGAPADAQFTALGAAGVGTRGACCGCPGLQYAAPLRPCASHLPHGPPCHAVWRVWRRQLLHRSQHHVHRWPEAAAAPGTRQPAAPARRSGSAAMRLPLPLQAAWLSCCALGPARLPRPPAVLEADTLPQIFAGHKGPNGGCYL